MSPADFSSTLKFSKKIDQGIGWIQIGPDLVSKTFCEGKRFNWWVKSFK